MAKERPGMAAGIVKKNIKNKIMKKLGLAGDPKKKASRAKFEKERKAKAGFFGSRRGGTSHDPSQLASARKYKIKSGDTLSQIARNYGVSLKALQKANNIDDANKIRAGRTLTVPGGLKPKATNVYKGTDTKKIAMPGSTPAKVAAQKKRNVKIDAEEKAKNKARIAGRKRPMKRPTVKKMATGGVARGMGAATKGGKFTRSG